MNLKETELRLGLPGSESPGKKSGNGVSIFGLKDDAVIVKNSRAKRAFSDANNGPDKSVVLSMNGAAMMKDIISAVELQNKTNGTTAPSSKAQVVGWPPVRSFHKNSLSKQTNANVKSGPGFLSVKVSMDGAPYLRKIDLKTCANYAELSTALEKMFTCFTIGQCGDGLAGKEHLSESCVIDLLHGSEYVLTYEDRDGDWMLVGDVPWEMFIDSCKRLRILKSSDAIGLAPRTVQKCNSRN